MMLIGARDGGGDDIELAASCATSRTRREMRIGRRLPTRRQLAIDGAQELFVGEMSRVIAHHVIRCPRW